MRTRTSEAGRTREQSDRADQREDDHPRSSVSDTLMNTRDMFGALIPSTAFAERLTERGALRTRFRLSGTAIPR